MNDHVAIAGRGRLVRAGWIALVAALALACGLLTTRALYGPVLYPDTLGYLQAGKAAFRAAVPTRDPGSVAAAPGAGAASQGGANSDGVSVARSPYYGLLIFAAYETVGFRGAAALNWAWLVIALWLAAAAFLPGRPLATLLACGAAIVVGGAGAIATVVMPDIFAGLAILAVAMLVALPQRSRLLYLWWFATLVAAIAFHKSHQGIAAAMLVPAALVAFLTPARTRVGLVLIVAAIAVGSLCHMAVDYKLRRTGVEPVATPFLLARVIGDGTGERYLRESCPTHAYVTCRFLGHMPMTENDFLWQNDPKTGAFGLLRGSERLRVVAEQRAIVEGTLRSFPLQQAQVSLSHLIHQLLFVGVSEFALPARSTRDPSLGAELRAYGDRVPERTVALRRASAAMTAGYLLSFAVVAVLAWLGRSRARHGLAREGGGNALMRFVVLLLLGVLVNAAICGMISGVFDRYQGRVAWLVPLAAALMAARFFPNWPLRGSAR